MIKSKGFDNILSYRYKMHEYTKLFQKYLIIFKIYFSQLTSVNE